MSTLPPAMMSEEAKEEYRAETATFPHFIGALFSNHHNYVPTFVLRNHEGCISLPDAISSNSFPASLVAASGFRFPRKKVRFGNEGKTEKSIMPLTRLEVRNEFRLGDPELYRAAKKDDSKAILDGVAVAGLVGILRQLGDLADRQLIAGLDPHHQMDSQRHHWSISGHQNNL
ncbi:hypothetical protein ACLOJK_010552 [Asimina triloba]